MAENNLVRFESCREDVYARLRRYTAALDNPDDQVIAALARSELPRYLRYWMALLAQHEPTPSGKCPTCFRWGRAVPMPCDTWKWAQGFLRVTPARTTIPPAKTPLTPRDKGHRR